MTVIIDGSSGVDRDGDLVLETNGTERVRIDTSGQITGGNSAGATALALTSTATAVNARIRLTTTSDTSSVSYVLGNSHASVNKQASHYLVGADGGLQFQVNQAAGAEPTTGTSSLQLAGDGSIYQKASAGLGYGTGAGGTVTQATSKSTAVTLNKPTGQITMNNASLGANTAVIFDLNNSLITSSDAVVVSIKDGSVTFVSNYTVTVAVGTGVARIAVVNRSGGSLSEAVVLNFAIIKGATS